MKYSFVMLKPDAIKRNLVDTIIRDLQKQGIKIEQQQTIIVDEDLILKHYEEVIERLHSETFTKSIIENFVGKEVVILKVYDQDDVVEKIRKLIGVTDPTKAEKSTIRGKYGIDSFEKSNQEGRMLQNLIHASDSDENAMKELNLWFKKNS